MKAQENSIREKIKSILTSPFVIIEVFIISSFLMFWLGSPGFFFGLFISLITLWAIKWDWSYFGLGDIKWLSSIVPALGFTIIIILLNDIILEPWLTILTQTPIDLEAFEGLRDNIPNLLIMLSISWTVAAFGEEFFYRGYIMNRLANIMGNNKKAWILATFLSSFVFGIVHAYQGTSGMISTGFVGLILAFAFYMNKNNLWVGILTHGIYDTYGLTMIYLGSDQIIKNIMIEIYQTLIIK